MGDVTPNQELVVMFEKAGLTRADCELVAKSFEIPDVRGFYNHFEPPENNCNFKQQMFDHIPDWQMQWGKVGKLRVVWLTAVEWERRGLGSSGASNSAELDTPLGTAQHNTLRDAFKAKHHLTIPPSWVWTDQMVGRTFRSLQLRRTEQTMCGSIRIYPGSDDKGIMAIVTQPQGQTRNLMPGVSLISGAPTVPKVKPTMPIHDYWLYLHGLNFWAYSCAVAGCFKVEQQVLDPVSGNRRTNAPFMVELDDLLKHVAQAHAFVTMHLDKKLITKEKIFSELKRHDESIRHCWGGSFNEDSTITFSQSIRLEKNVAYAQRQWDEDYTMHKQVTDLVVHGGTTSKATGGPPASRGLDNTPLRKGNGKRDGRSSSRDKKSRKERRERSPKKAKKEFKIIMTKGKVGDKLIKIMSGRAFKGGGTEEFCKAWHGRGDCKARDCKRRHRCDIVISLGDDSKKPRACDQDHRRCDHKGATFEA